MKKYFVVCVFRFWGESQSEDIKYYSTIIQLRDRVEWSDDIEKMENLCRKDIESKFGSTIKEITIVNYKAV